MKNLLILIMLTFSFTASAVSEKDLSPEQKSVLYEIHNVIESEYPLPQKEVYSSDYDEEYDKAVKEIEIIISSVKSFGEKIQAPVENFLETDLAKYIGIIVVFNFFGENLFDFVVGILVVGLAFYGLRSTKNIAYTNFGEITKEKGYTKKHGEFEYEKITYLDGKSYPFVNTFSLAILTILGFVIIF
jgi:hypothetical protein